MEEIREAGVCTVNDSTASGVSLIKRVLNRDIPVISRHQSIFHSPEQGDCNLTAYIKVTLRQSSWSNCPQGLEPAKPHWKRQKSIAASVKIWSQHATTFSLALKLRLLVSAALPHPEWPEILQPWRWKAKAKNIKKSRWSSAFDLLSFWDSDALITNVVSAQVELSQWPVPVMTSLGQLFCWTCLQILALATLKLILRPSKTWSVPLSQWFLNVPGLVWVFLPGNARS